jgi:ornithine cyclodeaminase/alanine dehydrogenase-like protein (mu-crystallin family)
MQRALVACGVAGVADDSEDGFVSALRVDGHEIADLHTAAPSGIAARHVVDLAGVEVTARIALVVICNISEGGL